MVGFEIVFFFASVKVSMLTHTYPHIPQGQIMWSDQVIFKPTEYGHT